MLLTEGIRKQLDASIGKQMKQFDREAFALRTRRGPGYNYHSHIRDAEVHMIRESFYLALALLDRNEKSDTELGLGIVDRLLTYQDLVKESRTYGIWPYYMEEPFAEMLVPDWNWADFCGKTLIQIAVDYSDRLRDGLKTRIMESIEAAAISIMRRNVKPSYTNISIMGTYVSLLAGELLGHEELFRYGQGRLRNLHAYTVYHGTFTEYNSPTYTVVAIEDLSLMLRHFKNEDSRRLVRELHDLAWKSIAEHFHASTRQWAGPHSRDYQDLQGKGFLSFLQLASGGKLHYLEEEELEIGSLWARVGLAVPELYLPYFQEERTQEYTETIVVKGQPTQTAASFLAPDYVLGSFNHSDLWNQRRALIAYWGTRQAPSYLRVRCIHDDYDFSSALLHTVQHRNVLVGIGRFCLDHGDKHISLDPINGTITGNYLAFRFEIGGSLEGLRLPESLEPGKPWIIGTPHIKIGLVLMDAAFGNRIPQIQVVETDGVVSVDVVFYEGESATLDFNGLGEAFAAFGLILESADRCDEEIMKALSSVSMEREDGRIQIGYADEYTRLRLHANPGVLPYWQAMRDAQGIKETLVGREKSN